MYQTFFYDLSNAEQPSSVAADATQRARERAAQLAAKLAKEGKLASGARPPPILVRSLSSDL